jgi:hypothetical protein
MQRAGRITAAITAALMMLCTAAGFSDIRTKAEGAVNDVRKVTIDASKANTKENMLYKGNGMVSANNTSRLLMDYKTQSPEAYQEIMEHLFLYQYYQLPVEKRDDYIYEVTVLNCYDKGI